MKGGEKMKKRIITLGLVAVLLLGVAYAYAQKPGMEPGPEPGMGHGHKRMHEFWGPGKDAFLTPEQKVKFQELRRKFNEETAQLKGLLLTKRLELQSLWTNPKAESKAILDKERELREVRNRLGEKAIQYMLEAREVLTPEQITEFGQHFGMGFGFGRGHMMGHGGEMDYCWDW